MRRRTGNALVSWPAAFFRRCPEQRRLLMATPFAREPRAGETAVATGVLVVLALIAAWLWHTQRQFSPAVTVAAAAARAAEAGTTPPAPDASATATLPAAPDLLSSWPDGLHAMSPAEAFTAETLSDKIDGKAELYLSANVVGLRCQRIAAGASAWFEAFIYDMGTPENAFAVYSSQKRTSTEDGNVGDYSYRAGNQLCLVHGSYYVECVGADDGTATRQGETTFASAFLQATPVPRHANMARDESLFPTEGRVPGSLMLMSADVFGFDQLNHTYVARYHEGTGIVTVFLSRRADANEAAQLARATRGFFVDDCGGRELPSPGAPAGAAIVETDGKFDGVFAREGVVGGVRQAPTRATAEQWLQRLDGQLQRAATAER